MVGLALTAHCAIAGFASCIPQTSGTALALLQGRCHLVTTYGILSVRTRALTPARAPYFSPGINAGAIGDAPDESGFRG